MKPSEFERVNEGLKDVIAKTGIMGQTAKLSAEQQAKQEKIYKIAGKNFQNQLFKSIDSAVKSGLVAPPGKSTDTATTASSVPTTPKAATTSSSAQPAPPPGQETVTRVPKGKMLVIPRTGIAEYYKIDAQWFNALGQKISDPKQTEVLDNKADAGGAREQNVPPQGVKKGAVKEGYEGFNTILERQILKEQENLSDFVFDFVMSQASNLEQKPAYIKRAKDLSSELQTQYDKSGKIPTADSFSKLWDLLWSWNQTSSNTRKSQSSRSTTGSATDAATSANEPEQQTDVETQRTQFQKKLIDGLKSIDFNDGSTQSIDTLEKISKMLSDYVAKAKNV